MGEILFEKFKTNYSFRFYKGTSTSTLSDFSYRKVAPPVGRLSGFVLQHIYKHYIFNLLRWSPSGPRGFRLKELLRIILKSYVSLKTEHQMQSGCANGSLVKRSIKVFCTGESLFIIFSSLA